ncbi:MAG: MFS transporter [Ilumatobacteraceae bacterium]
MNRLLVLGLFLAVSIAALEATAVITALPTIVDELDGRSLYGFTLAAYMLATLLAIVSAGRAADRSGPARPFALSVLLFVIGLAVAGVAPSMPIVVLGRFLQGAGTGGFNALAYVGVRLGFEEDRQPTVYAILSAGWVLPSLVAPLISGSIVETVGWRWVFLGMLLPAVVVGLLTHRELRKLPTPPTPPPGHGSETSRLMRDALALVVGAGALLGGLAALPRSALGFLLVVPGLALAAVGLRSLFPSGWLRARTGVPATISCRLLAAVAFMGVDSFVPLAADRVHHVGAIAQGLVIIGAALTWSVGQAAAAPAPRPGRGVHAGPDQVRPPRRRCAGSSAGPSPVDPALGDVPGVGARRARDGPVVQSDDGLRHVDGAGGRGRPGE